MKTSFVCGLSALEFWQGLRCRERPSLNSVRPISESFAKLGILRPRSVTLGQRLPSDEEMTRLCQGPLSGLEAPIDMLASTGESCALTKLRKRFIWSGPLPRNSAVQIAPGVLVATPEFLFLQLSRTLTLPRLTLLAYELCGSYALPVRSQPGSGEWTCQQATSVERLRDYLEKPELDHAYGIRQARKSIGFVTEISHSPRESAMVMLLCLPSAFGGYGLPLPRMNAPVYVPSNQRHIVGREWFSIDAYWPDCRFGIEYDGREAHRGSKQVERDYSRANALSTLGCRMSSITNAQISDESSFDLFAHQTAHKLGIRLRIRRNYRQWLQSRRTLRSTVLGTHGWPGQKSEARA
jgi:hypothetical protein